MIIKFELMGLGLKLGGFNGLRCRIKRLVGDLRTLLAGLQDRAPGD